jgi:proline iminopeptidase
MPSLFQGRTPAIRNGTPRSIAALERTTLGGVEQWLTLRGHDTSLPLLLYVHGGPGTPDLGAIRHFVPELEQRFLVAHWCQRGGGKSYTRGLADDRMTMAQFLDDLEELSQRLLQRFGKRKLFLVGQSWGTVLGMRMLARRPDLVAAYVGVNQVVDRAEEELRTHHACLRRARERGNRKAVAQLEALGEPTDGMYASVQGTLAQRGWVRALGMVTCEPAFAMELGKAIAMSPEVTVRDLFVLFARLRWNMELLWPEFCRVSLAREIAAVEAPVFFVAGEHDQITSPELARAYLDTLRAPRKEFVLFPRSGHVACFEEPRRFLEVMLRAKAAVGPVGVHPAP